MVSHAEDLTHSILELIRLASTDLPVKVEMAISKAASLEEEFSAASFALDAIQKNIELTRHHSLPICQDTGTPLFFVIYPRGWNQNLLRIQIRKAVESATKKSYLRPNAVESLQGYNSGNNLGDDHFPAIYFEETEGEELSIDLLLKGGGCENVGAQYSLPDDNLHAGRDLEGVRRVVLDAVFQAQGQGCAPGFLGVAIGGDRGTGYLLSKKALLRKFGTKNPEPVLAALEEQITQDANKLGIGPMGFGGKVTVLETRLVSTYRLPASYFVTISYMCWAYRHRKMVFSGGKVNYEQL